MTPELRDIMGETLELPPLAGGIHTCVAFVVKDSRCVSESLPRRETVSMATPRVLKGKELLVSVSLQSTECGKVCTKCVVVNSEFVFA